MKPVSEDESGAKRNQVGQPGCDDTPAEFPGVTVIDIGDSPQVPEPETPTRRVQFVEPLGSEAKNHKSLRIKRTRQHKATSQSRGQMVDGSVPEEVLKAIACVNEWIRSVPSEAGAMAPMEQVRRMVDDARGLQDVDDLLSEMNYEARRKANALSNLVLRSCTMTLRSNAAVEDVTSPPNLPQGKEQ